MGKLFQKYHVVLGGKVRPEYNRDEVLVALANIFNSSPSKMDRLLMGQEVPLKKEYDESQAELIRRKIEKAGAVCRIESIDMTEIELLDESTLLADSDEDYEGPGHIPVAGGWSAEGGHKDHLVQYVLDFVHTNVDYYRNQFARFGRSRKHRFRLSWNWPAFFSFYLWALYRKMWLLAALNFVGSFAMIMWFQPGLVYLAWGLGWPLTANYWYFRRALTHARLAQASPADAGPILSNGGVSRRAVWLGAGFLVLGSVMLSNYITARFLEQYGDQLEEVMPGSGSQVRGDGSIVYIEEGDNSDLARTSASLTYLATSLKIITLSREQGINLDQLNLYVEELNKDNVKDAWNTSIRAQAKGNRLQLVSSGPDQVFDTDDDIIQSVTLSSK